MTTSSTTNKFRYEGNGVTDTFAFTGRIFNTSDIKVNIITRATDALVETLTETTHYTVTINGDESAEIVVVASKIPSASQDIQLLRVLPKTQTLDLPTGTRFPAESVEDALDKSISIIQDLSEVVDRSIKLSEQSSLEDVELPTPEASKLIGWNVAANNLANYELADLSLTINTAFSGLANNDMMIYNGTNWVNQPFTSNIDIDALTAMSAAPVATTDYIAMYDDSAGTTLKILPSDFYETINTLTADATPNPAVDYVVTYDASALAAKKVLLNDILDNVSAQEPLSGASLTAVTVAANDKVLIQDTGDSDNLKTVTAQSVSNLNGIGHRVWAQFDGTGGVSIGDSEGISSINRVSAGVYDVSFTNNFANTGYFVSVQIGTSSATSHIQAVDLSNRAVGSIRITVYADSGGTPDDDADINFIAIGTLA